MVKVKDIEASIDSKGIKKTWLMKKLGISRGTFYDRLKNEEFKQDEFFILKDLGLVR